MKYVIARTAGEALGALTLENGKALIMAGGSDIMVELIEEKRNEDILIDVTQAKDMKGIRVENEHLVIGAAATMTEIHNNQIVKEYFPSLAKGCGSVGSLQIRNSATLAGNVVSAQPAADGAMALAPLNAQFVVLTTQGTKIVPFSEMYAGIGKSKLDPHREVIKEIRIPLSEADEKASFIRLELRKSLSLPMLSVSAMLKYKEGRVEWSRICMAPVGVGPVRAEKAEEYLWGKALTPDVMAKAGELAAENASFRSNPLRGSKEYRRHSLPVLVRRALEDIAGQLGVL